MMRGFWMNKNNPLNTFANRFWHSDTCLDVEMNKSKYFMEYIQKYYAESRKTPEDIYLYSFSRSFKYISSNRSLFPMCCAGLLGLGWAGRGRWDVWCVIPSWHQIDAGEGHHSHHEVIQLPHYNFWWLLHIDHFSLSFIWPLWSVTRPPPTTSHQPLPTGSNMAWTCLLFNINWMF